MPEESTPKDAIAKAMGVDAKEETVQPAPPKQPAPPTPQPRTLSGPHDLKPVEVAENVLLFLRHRVDDMINLNRVLGREYNEAEIYKNELNLLIEEICG